MKPRNTLFLALAGLVAVALVSPVLASTGSPPVPEPSTLIRLAGRLHPLIIHFPIALILTAGLLEIVRVARRRAESSHTAHVCLMIGALFAMVAVGSGLANASAESHGPSIANTLWWHKWFGISTAILVVSTLVWATFFRNTTHALRRRIYLGGLLVSMSAIAMTGHFGGTMVYGEGYILGAFESAPDPVQSSQPPPVGDDAGAAAMFASVQEIFESRCYECHGPNRQRADLRLDQFTHDWALDQSLWVIKPGNSAESELVQRISRADGVRGRMPARGDRLTDEQIALLTAWINAGAVVPGPSGQEKEPIASTPDEPTLKLAPQLPPLDPSPQVEIGDPEAVGRAIKRLTDRGAIARPVSQDSNGIEVSFALLGSEIIDSDLDLLVGLEDSLVWLDLARTGITDEGVGHLTGFTQLRRLHLEQTGITDAALVPVGALHRLEYLNLFKTAVTDTGLDHLRSLANLRRLYLWQTGVTATGVETLQKALPELGILTDTATPVNDG